MSKAIQSQVEVKTISIKPDKSLRMSLITPKLTSEQLGIFIDLQNKTCELLLTPQDEMFAPIEKVDKEVGEKSDSQRMRNTLFVLWQQGNQETDFNTYYHTKMEQFINHLKKFIKDEN